MATKFTFSDDAFSYISPIRKALSDLDIEKLKERYLHDLEAYEAKTPMTRDEQQALREWVSHGHSVFESPESKYVRADPYYAPEDFLIAYRREKDFERKMKKMSPEELRFYREAYDAGMPPDVYKWWILKEKTPTEVRDKIAEVVNRIRDLERFLRDQGLYDKAKKYVSHKPGLILYTEDEFFCESDEDELLL